jgi:RNA polymerase-interacting CarD/CdnL/TRCF family regulator
MNYNPGDQVVHPQYGVGTIIRVEDRQLAEQATRQYYVLMFGKTTVWIPVETDRASSLRRVTAAQDLEPYRALLQSQPVKLDKDYKKRRTELHEQLARGSFQVLCEVVRDLTALGWHKPVSGLDATLLKRVRDDLWHEWAASTGKGLPDAMQEVTALLWAGERAYKS